MDTEEVQEGARAAKDHDALEGAARVGYAVNGVLHLLIGWIALQLAWFGSGKSADQSGALTSLASNGFGKVILWIGVVGFLGLAVWQIAEAIGGSRKASDRVKAVSKAVVYLVLTFSAFTFASGGSSSSKQQSSDATATLMSKPFGAALVGIVGLVVIGVGVYHVVKGWKRLFLQDLKSNPGEGVVTLGRFGYIAKGIALVVLGGLFGIAALRNDPKEATGLDGALRTLLEAPFGKVLLTVV
ncbi:MAG: DUF1206 domain-containing protein, partial [Dermatophilaceae bacterium]